VGYRLLADALVVFHFAFLLFVVLGGWLVWRWPRLAWLHLPCAVWGALVELTGLVCPLTPLEGWLRQRAGMQAYTGGFIAHYLLRVLYPAGLTRGIQLVLAVVVVAINGAAYATLIRRTGRARRLSAEKHTY
jgi:hypothetical protein